MTNRSADMSPKRAARVAGIALLAEAVLAIFVNFVVTQSLVVSGDAGHGVNRNRQPGRRNLR